MNILYIAGYTSPSFRRAHGDNNSPGLGGERKVELISSILVNAGHNVIILSSAMLSNSKISIRPYYIEYQKITQNRHIKIVYPSAFMFRPFGGLINCMRSKIIIKKIINEFVPDVAFVYNTYLFEALASTELLKRNIPIVLEVEDLPLARYRGLMNIKPRLDQLCWNYMLKMVSAFTAVNQPIYDMLPSCKPRLLLPGIIDQNLVECSKQRRKPFSGDKRYLGYFGALTHDKGVNLLLEIVPRLRSPWQLIVTGSGPLSSSFEKLSKEYPDRLKFLGKVDKHKMYEAMCECDCLVIPPENITNQGQGVFPFKTFEYAVSGAHIISTKLPLHDLSKSALFFQRWDGSLNALLQLINQSLSDFNSEIEKRTDLSKYIVEKFSTESIANKLKDVFSIVSNKTT
jgi:glycosyltransferase involved in cell wall biosynthesis